MVLTSANRTEAAPGCEDLGKRLQHLISDNDAAVVKAPDGRIVVSIHAGRPLVPASILKLLTSLASLHYLGADYRFPTEFYLSGNGNLKIKGFGDPLLVSERLREMAAALVGRIDHVQDLILDAGYFAYPVDVPGRGRSDQPYDAPNGALCVNFNTVNFSRQGGQWVSAEPQTPLLSSVIPKIEASGLTSGRITLAAGSSEGLRYAGDMFAYFLGQAGMKITGAITPGKVDPRQDHLLWRFLSSDDLPRVIAELLQYSNNFIANQLLLSIGARLKGPPATMEKGLEAMQVFYRDNLGIRTGRIVEGSGLSRENRVTAEAMMTILERFEPYHALMRREGRQFYKTGTLNGIRTRAGYLVSGKGGLYRFVVMHNTPGKSPEAIMRILEGELK